MDKRKPDLKDENLFYSLIKILFFLYVILLVWAIFFKFGMGESLKNFYINYSSEYSPSYRFYRCIIPFTKIVLREGEYTILPAVDVRDALNVFVFVPFGFFVYFINKENIKKTFVHSFCTTAIIEGLQYFTLLGAFASKDIVTNFLGAVIGIFAFKLFKKIKFTKIHNILAIILICMASIVIVVAVVSIGVSIDDYLFVLLRKKA